LLVVGAVLSVAPLRAGVARAQGGPVGADVVITGDANVAAGLEDVVSELLERRGIAARITRAAHVNAVDFLHAGAPTTTTAPPACRIWIDLNDGHRVRIFLSDVAGERFAIRELALHDHVDEVARESIGQLVAAAASALSEGTETGVSLEEAERTMGILPQTSMTVPKIASTSPVSRAPVAAHSPQRRTASLDLGAFYAAAAFAPQHWLTHGPGLLFDWGATGAVIGPRAWLLLGLQLPLSLGDRAVSGRLAAVTGRVGVAVERGWTAAALSAGIGAGADLVHVASRAGTDPSAMLGPAAFLVVPSMRLQVVLKAHLGRDLYVVGAVTCDVDLLSTSYFFSQVGQEVEAVTPWRVHPGLLIGAIWR
jgi:hypothetical protein